MDLTTVAIIVVAVLVVALLVVPFIWSLLASRKTVGAKGAFQKKAVTELLTLKDRLSSEGHPAASKLCRESVIALICDETPNDETPTQKKSLFQ